jgi:hypothetical protein
LRRAARPQHPRALSPTPERALGDAGNFGPRAAMRSEFMPRARPTLYYYFGGRTSGDSLIGQNALEILIYVSFMKFRKELLKNGLKFAFFFSEG